MGIAFAFNKNMRLFITRVKAFNLHKTGWMVIVAITSFTLIVRANIEGSYQAMTENAGLQEDAQFKNPFEQDFDVDVAGIIGTSDSVEDGSGEEGNPVGYLGTLESENGENQTIFVGEFDISESNASLSGWYGPGFHGRKTCTGERYDQDKLTLAAHKWLGKTVCVSGSGKRVTARINDCGPYEKRGGKWVPHRKRAFDLSRELMRRIKGKASGLVTITVRLGSC